MLTRTALVVLLVIGMILPTAGIAAAQENGLIDPTVEREVLFDRLISPTGLDVADDGRVVIIHREGRVTVWEQDGTVTDAARLAVDAYDRAGGQYDESACPRGEECPAGYNHAEGGIHGVLLAPDFLETGHLYLYYTVADSLGQEPWPAKHPDARPWCAPVDSPDCLQDEVPGPTANPLSDEGVWRLSRFTMDLGSNEIDLATELPLFENPAEWFFCCHYAGDMEWKSDGTLLLSTGDDTSSDHSNQYSPHDQRPDHTWNSAALTSANLADRRGKMLRIDVEELESGAPRDTPEGDGIPGTREGIAPNPFAEDEGADPYVYAYGLRNPYKFAYDAETDHVYVGTVGPDAIAPDPQRGPAAHDEIEVIPPGGGSNHGWPYCIADNIPYNEYDFRTGTAGEPFSCDGMTPAAIWYTKTPSPTSPYLQMQGGGNTAMGGVSYRRPDTGALRLPELYDDQFLWLEWSRGQMWRMPITADGSLDNSPAFLQPVAIGFPFLLNPLRNPTDAATGPDGAVYLVEVNGSWNTTSGMLTRITCAGCTPDPADYGGVRVLDPTVGLAAASVDGGLVGEAPTWLLALVLLAGAGALGLRRRRLVV